jgi:tRNA A37 threonylcarbamoyladenosine modification protein TsaB
VATDARRRELYWARYSAAAGRLSGPGVTAAAGTAVALPAGLPVAGEGPHLYPETFGPPIGPRYPSAATLAAMAAERLAAAGPFQAGGPPSRAAGARLQAAGAPFLPPEPLYLRRPDARVPGPPKPVSPGPGAARGAAAIVRAAAP